MKTVLPQSYKSALGVYDTQKAIGMLKRLFEDNLSAALRLYRVSAPLFVEEKTGLNDNLSGVERPVSFEIAATGTEAQVVHSLAKWKRFALKRYGFAAGEGIYTDMNAIRRDEDVLDNLHSVYVDQWDWEKVITKADRTVDYLKDTVNKIVGALCDTQETLCALYPALCSFPKISREVKFVTAQELEDMYPDKNPKERENLLLKEYKTAFIMQIGKTLASGEKHDGRAPDYDDWELNGDLMVWYDMLGCAVELSSMGIRVDEESLDRQLTLSGCDDRRKYPYHQMLLNGELPLTIGGGIGQSRVSMVLLEKAHIGEVQASVWTAEDHEKLTNAGIMLL